MAGFLAVLVPVLGLGLGGTELAHWMSLRQTLSLALMDAARAGTTRQASPQAIADAFEQGLRMVYIQPAAQARALTDRRRTLGAPWRIRIQTPGPAAFLDHADASLHTARTPARQALIRNDHQAAQHQRRIQQGWPQGRGPRSGLTVYEANTLSLDLWWPQTPLAPGAAAVIRALAPLHEDPIGRDMMTHGYLPFRRHVRLAMQSDPAAWPDLRDGRVVHATGAVPGDAGPVAPTGQPVHDPNPFPGAPGSPASGTDTAPPAGQAAPPAGDRLDGEPSAGTPDAAGPGQEPPGDMPQACAP